MLAQKTIRALLICLLSATAAVAADDAPKPDFSKVPGVVIDHNPAATGRYIGSASIAILPDGAYVASHDFFGPKSTEHVSAKSAVFRSEDRGQTWKQVAKIDGAFWSKLFVHQGRLYLMGTTRHHGFIVIRRSDDGGQTWTEPKDVNSGLLTPSGEFHTAPMPVIVHDGRLWRGFEDAGGGKKWGIRYRAMMMSAPVDADLLKRKSWQFSNYVSRNPEWMDGHFRAWLEGNAVVSPEGKMLNILRMHYTGKGGKAAIVQISDDGKTATFDPETGFIDFPGGAKKFVIRFDPKSKAYWSLVNPVAPIARLQKDNAASIRNTLAMMRSTDLKNWETRCILLYHPDVAKHGFQYPDWQFDGDDIIAAIRTGYDDGLGGAHNAHDANFLTFHRFADFRKLTMADSVVDSETLQLPPPTRIETDSMSIEGHGFAPKSLRNKGLAFANRKYVWQQVPQSLKGWRYTQTSGGVRSLISVTAKKDGVIYIATSSPKKVSDTGDWRKEPKLTFGYTDTNNTTMKVLSRDVKANDTVKLPQLNWSGSLLLIPPDKSK